MATTTPDLAALLAQVKTLESEKERMHKTVEDAQRKYEEERKRLAETQQKMGRLTEGKKQEMQGAFDNVIKAWLLDSVKDPKLREEFETGMTRLVENTEDESGVWQVVCCASNVHLRRLQELEQLKGELETLKTRTDPEFGSDASRKRGREADPPARQPKDIWADFEESMKGREFEPQL
jgi:hypothetical protein